MDIAATYVFDAPAEQVWALLMDTSAIATCLPGCRGLRPLGADRYEAELSVAVAAISGNFTGTVTLADKVPPLSYRLVLDGTGRPGFVRGEARIVLAPQGGKTTVQVASHADVGGTIARVGQRLLEGVARMTMDRFYGCLMSRVKSDLV
jgi:carbon monoxide dehydrogenase subunit G